MNWEDFVRFLEKEGVYSKYLHNYSKGMVCIIYRGAHARVALEQEHPTKWIRAAFIWRMTPEGHKFWEDINGRWHHLLGEPEDEK